MDKPIVGSCTTTSTYVFFVSSSSTAVKSASSSSIARKSSLTRAHACLNDLISSDVRSYRVGKSLCGSPSSSAPCNSLLDVVLVVKVDVRAVMVSGVESVGDVGAVEAGAGTVGGLGEVLGDGFEGGEEVAMTRKVVRSKRTTSVALQAVARVARCFDKT